MTDRKRVTIITPCFNEELNVRELHRRMRAVMDALPQYEYRHIFIDNASHDGTVAVLRTMAAEFPEVQVIVNARNFGHLARPCTPFSKRMATL
jgi:glycosyltransferase involved in cell wall biosynthesis